MSSTRYDQAFNYNLHSSCTTKLIESSNNGGHFYFVTSFVIRLIETPYGLETQCKLLFNPQHSHVIMHKNIRLQWSSRWRWIPQWIPHRFHCFLCNYCFFLQIKILASWHNYFKEVGTVKYRQKYWFVIHSQWFRPIQTSFVVLLKVVCNGKSPMHIIA